MTATVTVETLNLLFRGKLMRTIFEDTNLKAEAEETRSRGNESKATLPILWLVSLLFVGAVGSVYFWAQSRPAIPPPAPPVSLDDPKQTSEALSNFNHAILDGKWADAEAMLSTAAKQRLTNEQKGLAESLLGQFKDYRVVAAEMTQSIDRNLPGMVRVDCLYKFTNDPNFIKIDQRIISLMLAIEGNRLVIDNWSGVSSEEPKEERKTAVIK
jgi:hypothetical protein